MMTALQAIAASGVTGSPLYSLLMLAGIIFGAIYWYRASATDGRLPLIYFGGLAGAFLGAKLAFLFAEGWLHWHDPQRLKILLSGKSIMGALPGGWAGVELAKKALGYRRVTGDRFALLLPIPLILGRLGCLNAGCCQGIACRFGQWPAVPVEIGFQLAALTTLLVMRAKHLAQGQHFHLYLMAYGTFRFAHEFMRATAKSFAGLSGYQVIALGTVIAAAIAYRKRAQACATLEVEPG
jgi:phosphatidylglycerol:prolipoprotein diacylglycerol transferase